MKHRYKRHMPLDLTAPLPASAIGPPLKAVKVERRIRDTLDDKQDRIRKANGFI